MNDLLQETIRFYEGWLATATTEADYLRPLIHELKTLRKKEERTPFISPVVENWLEKSLQMPTAPQCEPLIQQLREKGRQLKWVPSPDNYINPEFAKGFAFTQLVGHSHREIESAYFLSNTVAMGFSIQAPGSLLPTPSSQSD